MPQAGRKPVANGVAASHLLSAIVHSSTGFISDTSLRKDTSKLPKPGNHQCNNLNHALTNKYQCAGWDCLVVLMMVVQLVLVQGDLNWRNSVDSVAVGHALSVLAGIRPLHSINFNLVLSTPQLPSPVTKAVDHKGLPYPSQHIAASWENQIGVLVCKTATNACWSKLALVFWSVLTLELLQVFPLPFSTHSSTSWENHQWTSAVGFSIIKFASLFLKMHRRHELESCVCYYWCLQGSRDLINIGSGSLLLVAFWGSGWDFCWSKHLCMP